MVSSSSSSLGGEAGRDQDSTGREPTPEAWIWWVLMLNSSLPSTSTTAAHRPHRLRRQTRPRPRRRDRTHQRQSSRTTSSRRSRSLIPLAVEVSHRSQRLNVTARPSGSVSTGHWCPAASTGTTSSTPCSGTTTRPAKPQRRTRRRTWRMSRRGRRPRPAGSGIPDPVTTARCPHQD
jgi:hypothetical protein